MCANQPTKLKNYVRKELTLLTWSSMTALFHLPKLSSDGLICYEDGEYFLLTFSFLTLLESIQLFVIDSVQIRHLV